MINILDLSFPRMNYESVERKIKYNKRSETRDQKL
jgi:hypothetical protein